MAIESILHLAGTPILAGERDWPYSFEYICRVLDLTADAFRQRPGMSPEPLSVAEMLAFLQG